MAEYAGRQEETDSISMKRLSNWFNYERFTTTIFKPPVFYTENIATPLLIMHNDDDGAVPWYQE